MTPDLRSRLAVAGVGVPACGLVVFAGGPIFALGLGLVAAIGVWEYCTMVQAAGDPLFKVFASGGALFFPVVVLFTGFPGAALYGAGLLMGASGYSIRRIPLESRPLRVAALTSFGIFYIGGLLSFGVPLREGWLIVPPAEPIPGDQLARTFFFFFPVVVTWLADTAAYFGGRTFGRRKLAPRISPNKTVEGAVSAVLVSPLVAAAYAYWVIPGGWDLQPIPAALFGIFVACFAILGDLVESALKRECGVKDSSGLLPGHGGLLDRLDSLLWALPAAYFFLVLYQAVS